MTARDSGYLHPVFSCAESQIFEQDFFRGSESEEWKAMNRAGAAVARQVTLDAQESLGNDPIRHLLVLVGKGHNGGDALIAARHLLSKDSVTSAVLVFPFGLGHLRPLVQRSLDQLQVACGNQLSYLSLRSGKGVDDQLNDFLAEKSFDVCIDGILGMQFRPPLRSPVQELLGWVNSKDTIKCRVAIDLPSGIGDESVQQAFRADFTCATGIAKAPLFAPSNRQVVGRIRYLDIGFFDKSSFSTRSVLSDGILEFRRELRGTQSHKKHYGHVFVIGGSASMPGAILMATRAVLRSGVGLVTSFVPESVVAEAAASMPEAMWVGLPVIPDHGGLALEGLGLVRQHASKATGWVIGPGMGTHEETGTLIDEILGLSQAPVILDADALRRQVIKRDWMDRGCVITPHIGEFNRLQEREMNTAVTEEEVIEFSKQHGCLTVLKGSPTRMSSGKDVVYSCSGGPVLARGGSGDVLSGLIGGRISMPDTDLESVVFEAVSWQGVAADAMARSQGQVAGQATDILSFL